MHLLLNITLALAALFASGGEEYTLTVLHTNDTHGRPLAFDLDGETAGGLAARKSAVDLMRAAEPNVILLDAGDVCDGMPVSNMNRVEPDFVGMGLVGYDAMAVGNHEFSHDVEGIDVRKNPQMADKAPSDITKEGSDPQTGHWPAVATPTPKGDRRIYPGAGSEFFHGKK